MGAVTAVVAAVLIIAVIALPGGSSKGGSPSTSFVFSQSLPTGTIVSNGQLDCGSNVTVDLEVPSYSTVNILFEVNETGASANIWSLGPAAGDTGFTGVGYGGPTYETLGIAVGGQIEFFLQGCGPSPTVPLGFWGNISLGNHLP